MRIHDAREDVWYELKRVGNTLTLMKAKDQRTVGYTDENPTIVYRD